MQRATWQASRGRARTVLEASICVVGAVARTAMLPSMRAGVAQRWSICSPAQGSKLEPFLNPPSSTLNVTCPQPGGEPTRFWRDNVARGRMNHTKSLRDRGHYGQRQNHRLEAPGVECGEWWSWRGSNPLPSVCQTDALPSELQPHATIMLSGADEAGKIGVRLP